MRLKPGSTLGPYEVLAPVGAGGMGEVYRARDQRLGRIVAIKLLSERFNDRLHREARAISALNHPNICQLYDICTEDGLDFLVMEYLEGETLAARLERGRLDYKEAIEIGTHIAEALDAAHSRGVVHRDLKPANVVLTASGVKLLDFGLARFPAAAAAGNAEPSMATVTEPGMIAGTLPYMAPEQFGEQAGRRENRYIRARSRALRDDHGQTPVFWFDTGEPDWEDNGDRTSPVALDPAACTSIDRPRGADLPG